MKAVHFGAGNIGRGFIGLILSQAGYEVIFSDVNDTLVSELQARRSYTVELANEQADTIEVTGVTAINGKNQDDVIRAVAEADLVTTAVGVSILPHIAAGIAGGIVRRIQQNGGELTLIACENAIGGSTILKEQVWSRLPEEWKEQAGQLTAFPDAAVDRIVPLQHHSDPLKVTVEPFYEWVVNRSQMKESSPVLEGVHYVDNLEPYIERKLFTVNTGHCSAAYLGYLNGYKTIQETMADAETADRVRKVMEETGRLLVDKYGFAETEHQAYIELILSRFRNPQLTDEVLRVGRSPIRKISANDRLVRPAMQAFERGLPYGQLCRIVAAALRFDTPADPEAVELQAAIQNNGVADAITHYTGIPSDLPLHREIVDVYNQLETQTQRL